MRHCDRPPGRGSRRSSFRSASAHCHVFFAIVPPGPAFTTPAVPCTAAGDFGPVALKALRQTRVEADLCRGTVWPSLRSFSITTRRTRPLFHANTPHFSERVTGAGARLELAWVAPTRVGCAVGFVHSGQNVSGCER